MKYYIDKKLNTDFNSAIEKVVEALAKEGFGVLSEIDIHEKFKEKLDMDFRRYKILGACNPALAYEVLKEEDKIGTLLPCNVIVQELDENTVEIAAIDPYASMQMIGNDKVTEAAKTVKDKLQSVLDNLQ